MLFRFWRLRLWFEARKAVRLSSFFAVNRFRGALGMGLAKPLFSPEASVQAPGGGRNLPRPFVFRARHLNGLALNPGERLSLDLHLFAPIQEAIVDAFEQVPPLYGALGLVENTLLEIALPLIPGAESVQSACVLFLTPTELKHENVVAAVPEFPILFARVLARLRSLSNLYGQPLSLDFERIQNLSRSVRMTELVLKHLTAGRLSTRTGRVHPFGGFTGRACYSGELRELWPFLLVAQHTGVGRQTAWGKGELQVSAETV